MQADNLCKVRSGQRHLQCHETTLSATASQEQRQCRRWREIWGQSWRTMGPWSSIRPSNSARGNGQEGGEAVPPSSSTICFCEQDGEIQCESWTSRAIQSRRVSSWMPSQCLHLVSEPKEHPPTLFYKTAEGIDSDKNLLRYLALYESHTHPSNVTEDSYKFKDHWEAREDPVILLTDSDAWRTLGLLSCLVIALVPSNR